MLKKNCVICYDLPFQKIRVCLLQIVNDEYGKDGSPAIFISYKLLFQKGGTPGHMCRRYWLSNMIKSAKCDFLFVNVGK